MRFRLSWIAFFLALNALATFLIAITLFVNTNCHSTQYFAPRTSYDAPSTQVHTIPEPSSLALMGAAAGVGLIMKWRAKP